MESGRRPCRGSPTGWTCGSSSSSTWRSSYLSTCCPDGPGPELVDQESLDAPSEHKQDHLEEKHLHSTDSNGERDFH